MKIIIIIILLVALSLQTIGFKVDINPTIIITLLWLAHTLRYFEELKE